MSCSLGAIKLKFPECMYACLIKQTSYLSKQHQLVHQQQIGKQPFHACNRYSLLLLLLRVRRQTKQ